MVVKEGYKNTEVGVIPEKWAIVEVEDILELLTDYDANGSFASIAENVKAYDSINFAWYVRSTDLENKTDTSKVRYIDERSYAFLKKTKLYGGELLFLKRGDIGNVYLFEMKTKYASLAPNLYLLKLNSKTIPTYQYYYFSSDYGQRQLKSMNAGSTLGALYKDDVKSIQIPLPPLLEQTAIATVLSDTDNLIQALEKKIAKKELIKKGVMQELLEPKEGWEVKTMGDVCEIRKGQLITSSTRIDGNIPVIAGGKTPAYYHKHANRTGKTITISASGANAGYVSFHNYPIFASDCSTISENINYSIEYIYFILTGMQNSIYKMQTGGAQPHIHPKDINPIIIPFPSISEQTHIAQILSDMDTEIESLQDKLSKYKQLKQGLMQELLTGRIRLV